MSRQPSSTFLQSSSSYGVGTAQRAHGYRNGPFLSMINNIPLNNTFTFSRIGFRKDRMNGNSCAATVSQPLSHQPHFQTIDLNNLVHLCLIILQHHTVFKRVFKDPHSGFTALTKLQPITWKLPSAAVVLKKIILLLQGTLVRVNDNGRTHLVVCWLLKH